jgi:hypothetical protein
MKIDVKITDDAGNVQQYVVSGSLLSEAEKIANGEFVNVGDEGLFPNHTDKDIWISGFVDAIKWVFRQ